MRGRSRAWRTVPRTFVTNQLSMSLEGTPPTDASAAAKGGGPPPPPPGVPPPPSGPGHAPDLSNATKHPSFATMCEFLAFDDSDGVTALRLADGTVKELVSPSLKKKADFAQSQATKAKEQKRQALAGKSHAEQELTRLQAVLFTQAPALQWRKEQGGLDPTVWETKGIEKARRPGEGQSAPVWFVKLGSGEIVVFKCVKKGEASRIFVGDRVVSYFGIRTPNFRFVLPDSPEFESITQALSGAVKANAELGQERGFDADRDDTTESCLDTLTNRFSPYEALMVLQFVKAQRIDDWLRDHDETQDNGAAMGRLFRHIGRLVVADMLIDNSDRFKLPSVWGLNASNTGNVMMSGNHEVVAIDHDLKYLATEEACDQQNRRVARLLHAYADSGFEADIDLDGDGDPIKQLVASLDANTIEGMYDSPGQVQQFFEGCEPHLRLGMLEGVVIVANFPQLWNPLTSPGMFQHMDWWEKDTQHGWPAVGQGLPWVDPLSWEALRARIKIIHGGFGGTANGVYSTVLEKGGALHEMIQGLYAEVQAYRSRIDTNWEESRPELLCPPDNPRPPKRKAIEFKAKLRHAAAKIRHVSYLAHGTSGAGAGAEAEQEAEPQQQQSNIEPNA